MITVQILGLEKVQESSAALTGNGYGAKIGAGKSAGQQCQHSLEMVTVQRLGLEKVQGSSASTHWK
ncbi:MAG: hypothetical protein GX564_13710 [Oligosphaeraceae bacterium]|nr:hypothetical protein [Oligosphaeraceae bacterium]